ncbi:MAG: ABC transporter substrate-binding protein [Oscillospiraceae bacterium]
MKKAYRLVLPLLITVSLLGLAGCKPKTSTEPKKEINKVETSSPEQELTFNNFGRELVIKATPKKVLTLGPNCTELFCALGLGDRVIGTSLSNHSRGPLPEFKEAYDKIPMLNRSSATREAVETSGADFIYGIDWEFGGDTLNIEELATLGITTFVNCTNTIEDQYQEIENIGKIFKVEDNASALIAEQKSRIKAVEDKIKGKEPIKVLVYDSGNDGIFTCGGINFETLLINMSGGKNIFDDLTEKQWVTISYEEAIARNPDIILVHDYDSPSVEEKIAEIKANPVLAQLDCVKNDRFARIELESVLPGNRMAYTIEKLSKAFYPDLFK